MPTDTRVEYGTDTAREEILSGSPEFATEVNRQMEVLGADTTYNGATTIDEYETEANRAATARAIQRGNEKAKGSVNWALVGGGIAILAAGIFAAYQGFKAIKSFMKGELKEALKRSTLGVLATTFGSMAAVKGLESYLGEDIVALWDQGGLGTIRQKFREKLAEDKGAKLAEIINPEQFEALKGPLIPGQELDFANLGDSEAIGAQLEQLSGGVITAAVTTRLADLGNRTEQNSGEPQAGEIASESSDESIEVKEGYMSVAEIKEMTVTESKAFGEGVVQWAQDHAILAGTAVIVLPVGSVLKEVLHAGQTFTLTTLDMILNPPNAKVLAAEIAALTALIVYLNSRSFNEKQIPVEEEAFKSWVDQQALADEKKALIKEHATILARFFRGEATLEEVAGLAPTEILNAAILSTKEYLNKDPEAKVLYANVKGLDHLKYELTLRRTRGEREKLEPVLAYIDSLIAKLRAGEGPSSVELNIEDFSTIENLLLDLGSDTFEPPIDLGIHDQDGYWQYTIHESDGQHRHVKLGICSDLDFDDQVEKSESFYTEEGLSGPLNVYLTNAAEGATESVETLLTGNPLVMINGYVHVLIDAATMIPVGSFEYVKRKIGGEGLYVSEVLDDLGQVAGGIFILGLSKDVLVGSSKKIVQWALVAVGQSGSIPEFLKTKSIGAGVGSRIVKSLTAPVHYPYQAIKAAIRYRHKIAATFHTASSMRAVVRRLFTKGAEGTLEHIYQLEDALAKIRSFQGATFFRTKAGKQQLIEECRRILPTKYHPIVDDLIEIKKFNEVIELLDHEIEHLKKSINYKDARLLARIRSWLTQTKECTEQQADEIVEKMAKDPKWLKLAGNMLKAGVHGIAVGGILYEAFLSEEDPRDTIMMHLSIQAALQAAQLGMKAPGPVILRLGLAIGGAALALFGINAEGFKDWIEGHWGEFNNAVWDSADDWAISGNAALAFRPMMNAVMRREMAKTYGRKVTQEAAERLFRQKLQQTVGKKFIAGIIKRLGLKAAAIVGGKAAVAGGVAVVPVAGWIVSAALLAWTAVDGYQIFQMINKAKKMNDAFKGQVGGEGEEGKPLLDIEIGSAHERMIQEEVDANHGIGTYAAAQTAYRNGDKEARNGFVQEYFDDVAACDLTIRRTDGSYEEYEYINGEPQYVKIVADGEEHELKPEDLEAAESWEPPADFHTEAIPYGSLDDEGLMQYYNLQVLKLKSSTEWSQINLEPVSPTLCHVRRHDLPGNIYFIMERKGETWTLKGRVDNKNQEGVIERQVELSGAFDFHAAVAQANICLDSIQFLMEEVHENKQEGWRYGHDQAQAFRVDGEDIEFDKDKGWDRTIYSEKWLTFYKEKLGLETKDIARNLNAFFDGVADHQYIDVD